MMRDYEFSKEMVDVVDGKVVISSEELANAIQAGEIDLVSEDEAGWNIICQISSTKL
ncbi:hypothetical protein [Pseudobutyrivibrio xylanivorans]|uniref:hypothetical protein n=1 Tax=Pseudobutyrivibrio xylanivorans TaxID=185007 RepID=UPI00142ECC03|nr:hypothetical protein [Pseudobutyrivibrio xylanivorans]